MAAHKLLGLSRLSNRKDIKTISPFVMNTKSLEESPASPSTTERRSPQERPSVHSQRSEWSALSICTRFPFIGNMTSHSCSMSEQSGLNGGKASDWLRPAFRGLSPDFIPSEPLRSKNDTHFPSILEGMRGIVGKKAGGLANARHSPPGC